MTRVFNLAPFIDRCPIIAQRELTFLALSNHPVIPDGRYVLFEMYCGEPACDCRQAMILVLRTDALRDDEVLAAFTFGWESRDFYRRWLNTVPHGDCAKGDVWAGTHLLPGEPGSAVAEAFLAAFKLFALHPENVERYKRHYHLYRKAHAAAASSRAGRRILPPRE